MWALASTQSSDGDWGSTESDLANATPLFLPTLPIFLRQAHTTYHFLPWPTPTPTLLHASLASPRLAFPCAHRSTLRGSTLTPRCKDTSVKSDLA